MLDLNLVSAEPNMVLDEANLNTKVIKMLYVDVVKVEDDGIVFAHVFITYFN